MTVTPTSSSITRASTTCDTASSVVIDLRDPAPDVVQRVEANRRCRRKRMLDLMLTVPLVVASAPLAVAVALAIKIVDRGPALFVQEREGIDGAPFPFFKFRTMYLDADRRLQEHLAADPSRRVEWETVFKLENDPRVLPGIGRFLRVSSLDELPNLWNILRGDMSLVGPRPFPTYHLERFEPGFRRLRCSVRPGLTGLWQIGRGGLQDQQQWDERYIAEWSLGNDVRILLRTVPVVLLARKAHY